MTCMLKQYLKQPIKMLFVTLTLLSLGEIAVAEISSTPVVGAIYNSTKVIKEHIFKGAGLTISASKNAALFTVGGVTLDVYILSLPLETKVKARVIRRLSNPYYAIPLGHFLYMFYDRYTGLENVDVFKQHLTSVYNKQQLKQYQHSLLNFDQPPQSNSTETADDDASSVLDKHLISSIVTIYDILFNNDDWLLAHDLPSSYTYLTDSDSDLTIIRRVQSIVIELMKQQSQSMAPGEFKSALLAIVEDAKPENANKKNNKAQAITISLIDFIRLNVLKSYRQFALEKQRTGAFKEWMLHTFKDDSNALIQFLSAQNNKPYGVQITVDGLQQGLMRALTLDSGTDNPFIDQVYQTQKHHEKFKPISEPSQTPEHQQQLNYLASLALKSTDIDASAHHQAGYLPFFKSLYRDYSHSIATSGISSTPTISVRNLPIIMTGARVAGDGGTGIPNFHFVDRNIDRAFYFYGNDALQLDRLIDDNRVQTMFERLGFLKTLSCNAQYDWHAQITYDGLVNLALGEAIRDFGEQRCLRELSQRASIEPKINKARTALIEEIKSYQKLNWWTPATRMSKRALIKKKIAKLATLAEKGMPDYVLMYIPWPDHFAHFTGPFSDEIISPTGELNRLDYWLVRFTQTYKDAGIYDNTLWGMAGDHGLAPVYYALNPEQQVLAAIEQSHDIKLNIVKISSDEGEGPKITNALSYPSNQETDVVVASTAGGNFMMDFFNASQGWQFQPVYNELTQWQPKMAPDGSYSIDIIHEISTRLKESLDYLVVRESPCNLERCEVRLVAHRDGRRIDEVITRRLDRIFYSSKSGDPIPMLLDIQSDNPYVHALTEQETVEKQRLIQLCLIEPHKDQPDSWCDETQWQELTRTTSRPDSVNQLAHIYDEDRAGTVNLFPKEGIGYNTKVPGRHAGEHYLEKDAFVGFWGAPVGRGKQLKSVENGSLAPTIYQFLTGEAVVQGENGWGYPSLLQALDIETPLSR